MYSPVEDWTLASQPPRPPRGRLGHAGDGSSTGAERIRVLVVDDEPLIVETLLEILAGEGFETMPATTGDDAVQIADAFEPHIVISDVVLPGMNGVEAAIKIRGARPDCRIILFSGQAATSDLLKQAHKQGYEFEILAKPIKPEDLLTVIRRRA